ncbi:MAG TPA: penicillin-binding protein 2 [Geminicoccaceae bacterium]
MLRDSERTRVFTRRALLLGGGQLTLFSALAGRLYYLQVVNADDYALLADENRINQRLLPPERGGVVDRHGVPLARNSPTYRVLIVREQAADLRATLQALSRLIDLPEERIEEVIAVARARRPFVPITVREDLNWTEVARISIHSPQLPGVMVVSGLVREYPAGEITAHVLGYVGPVAEEELTGEPLLELPEFRIGKNGVEKVYDQLLRGRPGISRFEVNALGREIQQLYHEDGQPGQPIALTIDLDLQRYVHGRLRGELSASAVVLDVRTGEVLALASVPTFDPGALVDGVGQETWRAWLSDPKAPLVNKAVAGQYPPGSTFKMIVALAALEAGVVGPDHAVFCPGFMHLGGHRFHCWRAWGHGKLTLVDAIAQSCDVYFYDLARKVGIDGIAEMARRFGLGQRLEIDLPGERPGLVPDKAWKLAARGVPWQTGETLVVGIGQGFLQATPLQLAVMTARIANGAQAVRPWLARPPRGAEGSAQNRPLGVSEWSLRFVKEGMHKVVNGERGTARVARLPNAEMAGKTGTSQVRRISRAERMTGVRKNEEKSWEERDHGLFVAFAPYRAPRYAVAVVVEHGGSGSQSAAPIARDIMAKALELDPSRTKPAISLEWRAVPQGGQA